MSIAVRADQRVSLNVRTPLVSDRRFGHNRWHPAIPPIARVTPGEVISLDLRDGFDVLFTPNTEAKDLLSIDWNIDIPMTGPLFIEGAEPGDLLEVEIVHIEPDNYAYTAIIPLFGLLGERFPDPYLVKWRIQDGIARSTDLPGVAIHGVPFLGLMGVAPSEERLDRFHARELALTRTEPSVKLPNPGNAVPAEHEPAHRGLRTAPPRETGGNMDTRQLTVGSRLRLPVDVAGALFSVGDTHFAQGDGESGGTAIEMSATAYLRFSLIKADDVKWRPRYPTFEFTEPATAREPRRYIGTTGLPIAPDGQNEFLNLNVAAKEALREMIDYLTAVRGYTERQAYIIVSVAADLRVSEVVDIPNALVSALLPLDIFEA